MWPFGLLCALAPRGRVDYFGSGMKTVNLEDALSQQPFRPVILHMDSGKEILVRHPDFLLFNEPKTAAVVAEGERFHVVDLEHVSLVTY